jgi:Protein of unknown function (DUF2752)
VTATTRAGQWAPPAALLTAGAGAAAYLAAVDPAHGGHYPICPFRTVTGLSCPLCGGLRATHALLTGHPGRAFELNALYVALLPLAVYAVAAAGLAARGRPVLPQVRLTARATWALVIIAVLFGVVRNLPGFHAWSAL